MSTIKTQCESCDGTGLYQGFAESPGTAVVCLACNGTGCEVISYKPFVKRRPRKGVHTVSRSRGSFLGTGVGAVGKSVSYAAFQRGKMP